MSSDGYPPKKPLSIDAKPRCIIVKSFYLFIHRNSDRKNVLQLAVNYSLACRPLRYLLGGPSVGFFRAMAEPITRNAMPMTKNDTVTACPSARGISAAMRNRIPAVRNPHFRRKFLNMWPPCLIERANNINCSA